MTTDSGSTYQPSEHRRAREVARRRAARRSAYIAAASTLIVRIIFLVGVRSRKFPQDFARSMVELASVGGLQHRHFDFRNAHCASKNF